MLDRQTQYGYFENLSFSITNPKFADLMDDEIEKWKKSKLEKIGRTDSMNLDGSHNDELMNNGTAENYNFEEELSEEEEAGLSVEYVECTFDVIEEMIVS